MLPPNSAPKPVDELLTHILTMLLKTWQETGFGHLTIDSQRTRQNKIQITVGNSTYYRHYITDEQVDALSEALHSQQNNSP